MFWFCSSGMSLDHLRSSWLLQTLQVCSPFLAFRMVCRPRLERFDSSYQIILVYSYIHSVWGDAHFKVHLISQWQKALQIAILESHPSGYPIFLAWRKWYIQWKKSGALIPWMVDFRHWGRQRFRFTTNIHSNQYTRFSQRWLRTRDSLQASDSTVGRNGPFSTLSIDQNMQKSGFMFASKSCSKWLVFIWFPFAKLSDIPPFAVMVTLLFPTHSPFWRLEIQKWINCACQDHSQFRVRRLQLTIVATPHPLLLWQSLGSWRQTLARVKGIFYHRIWFAGIKSRRCHGMDARSLPGLTGKVCWTLVLWEW